MLTRKGLLEFIEGYNHDNSAYWYGTIAGVNKATAATLNAKSKQYPEHYTPNRQSRYINDIQTGKKITDCSGLIKGYLMQGKYNAAYDLNDKGLIDKSDIKGTIDTLPEIPGIGLWKSGHVAVYIGYGKYKEAAGFSAGIRIGDNIKQFKKWFYIPYIEYEEQPSTYNISKELIDSLAHDVIRGKFGNYPMRKSLLNSMGYGDIYLIVQKRVNEILLGK